MGICKFCNQERELCDSHIIPEFMYKPMYQEKHQFYELSNIKKVRYHQKGLREKLLCKKCESFFSVYEGYAASVFRKISNYSLDYNKGFIIIPDVDYIKYKLFLLSVLWRMSISKKSVFKISSLGPYKERIHNLLLNKDPGKTYQYTFHQGIILLNGKQEKDLIVPPNSKRINGINTHSFVMHGMLFIINCVNHQINNQIPPSLKIDNNLVIYILEGSKIDSFISFMNEILQNNPSLDI